MMSGVDEHQALVDMKSLDVNVQDVAETDDVVVDVLLLTDVEVVL